jgi:hypothetical protein
MKPGWLEQRKRGDGAGLLCDWPAGEVVRVACNRCARAERYRLAGLIERFGPAAGGPDVLAALSADCPRRGVGQYGDPCGVYYPDFLALARARRL